MKKQNHIINVSWIEKNMKKLLSGAFIAICAVIVSGCALPEKPRVSALPAPQTSSAIGQDGSTPSNLGQPGTIGMAEQQPIVEKNIAVVPSMSTINDRIYEYGRKLDRWKEMDNRSLSTKPSERDAARMARCFSQLQDVLNGYNDLRSRLLQAEEGGAAGTVGNDEFYQLQKNDITFLEGECGSLLAVSEQQSAAWSPPVEGADLSQFEKMIDQYDAQKQYEEVIQVFSKIPESQRGATHLRTRILYAQALRYVHQEETAAQIYQSIVDQMADSGEQATDIVSLRKVLADLYTAAGNYRSATAQYQKISTDYEKLGQLEEWSKLQLALLARSAEGRPELTDYSSILRDYLGYVPARDGYKLLAKTEQFQTDYPYSPVSANVDLIREATKVQAERWFGDLMNQVDKLAGENEFNQALRVLESLPSDAVSTEKQLAIHAKIEQLQIDEAVADEAGKMAKTQDLQNQWNNGMLLANEGKYEEALAVFNTLLDSEYSSKARIKIDELSLEGAKAERKKAADYFIRFTRATDVESKKKLLVESRKLLKNILVKYPNVEIADKVQGNIDRVEQEMNAIDPNLVIMADREMVPETTETIKATTGEEIPLNIETGVKPPAY